MKKKMLNILIILCLFILIISIGIILNLISYNNEILNQKIQFVIKLILTLLPVISIILLPILIFSVSKIGRKQVIRESLSEIDFKNNKEYYRDILKEHSPSELSYIDNFELNLKKEIVATLLSLELKNKIKISNNNITVINSDMSDLFETESYILTSIKNGKVIIYNPYEMEGSTRKEAIDNGLIIKYTEQDKKETKPIFGSVNLLMIWLCVFWGIISILCVFNGPVVDFLNNIVIPNIHIILPFILPTVLLIMILRYTRILKIIFRSSYVHHKSKSYKRTELGEELNRKIEGLKNYLNNFSLLNEKDKEELMLWDEYLIYSVIFGLNNKIIKDLSCLIEFVK